MSFSGNMTSWLDQDGLYYFRILKMINNVVCVEDMFDEYTAKREIMWKHSGESTLQDENSDYGVGVIMGLSAEEHFLLFQRTWLWLPAPTHIRRLPTACSSNYRDVMPTSGLHRLCVCIYVYVYVYICVCTYMYMYMYISTYRHKTYIIKNNIHL